MGLPCYPHEQCISYIAARLFNSVEFARSSFLIYSFKLKYSVVLSQNILLFHHYFLPVLTAKIDYLINCGFYFHDLLQRIHLYYPRFYDSF